MACGGSCCDRNRPSTASSTTRTVKSEGFEGTNALKLLEDIHGKANDAQESQKTRTQDANDELNSPSDGGCDGNSCSPDVLYLKSERFKNDCCMQRGHEPHDLTEDVTSMDLSCKMAQRTGNLNNTASCYCYLASGESTNTKIRQCTGIGFSQRAFQKSHVGTPTTSCCSNSSSSKNRISPAESFTDKKYQSVYPKNKIAPCEPVNEKASCCAKPTENRPTIKSVNGCSCGDSSVDCFNESMNEMTLKATSPGSRSEIDLEKGTKHLKHVVLSVSGMTCTGCETKLEKVLGSLTYISNLKTSLVLSRVEFDIICSAITIEQVIQHLHRKTEFKCEKICNQGSSLDLIFTGDWDTLIKSQRPDGVLGVDRIGAEMIRIDFDANVIGARDLLNHGWSQGAKLAPYPSDPTLAAGSKHVRHMMRMTLLSTMLTVPVLIMAWAPLSKHEIAYGSVSLALASLVQVIIAGPFYPKAIKALLFSKVIEMDLLVVLSTSTAYIFSVVSFGYLLAHKPLSTGEFFETNTLLVTLIMVGRWTASLARQKAAESISIRSLQTKTALLMGNDGTQQEIDTRLLQYGDVFKTLPDSCIPTDGIVISGHSEVNESLLTGESRPVEKGKGSTVMAGSINGCGVLTISLTRLPGDNTITTIASMVDEAKLSKSRIQDTADTVASYFVPVVIILTIATFVVWIAVGTIVRHQAGSVATIEAITYAITVLIVSCPCAIGLAVPMVMVIASGVAAKRGVVFKSATSIEVAHKTTDVILDKTGTLTQGELTVDVDKKFVDTEEHNIARGLLLTMLENVRHPVSVAVVRYLQASRVKRSSVVSDIEVITGSGVTGKAEDKIIRAGNSRWLNVSDHLAVKSMIEQGLTVFCLTIDNELVAAMGLRDKLRAEATSVVAQLRQRGVNIHILSGDDDGAVMNVATQLEIPISNVRSCCSPADKQVYVQALLGQNIELQSRSERRKAIVMFVGDGTNDAVALAQATIGVHIASGTDIAQSAADVVLVHPELSSVLTAMDISKKAMHRVTFNFCWSFVYNLFAVLLGAGAFVHARIPPGFAGLGELVSVLPVVIAAVMLKWSRV